MPTATSHAGRPPDPGGLRRVITAVEIVALLLFELLLWISYRRQRLRWRTQGAVARWENDFVRGRRQRRPRRR
ncbi:MAG TPA: hypothetical protein VF743_07720 [Acidimicrobiales bacterium]